MAQIVKLGDIGSVLESRVASRLQRMQPNDSRMTEVLTRIGIMIEREAKLNIRRKKVIDTGSLFNSIRFYVSQQGGKGVVEVGSYGIPYAAVHEFGFSGSVQVQSHTRTSAFGRPTRAYTVPSYRRSLVVPKRDYLKPAVISMRKQIIQLIQDYYRGGA